MIPGSLGHSTIRKTRGVNWHATNSDNISYSVWLDGSADFLSRSTSSHSSTECVMSCWFQLTTASTGNIGLMGLGTGSSGSTNAGLWFSGNALYFYANGQGVVTNKLFRDAAWYHILGSWKLDESNAPDKGRLFINGEEIGSFSADPRSSWGTSFGSTATQSVGNIFTNTFLNGYIAQPIMLDGKSIQGGDVAITDFLDVHTFGDNGSQFTPKLNSDIASLASAAGGDSFCLDFSDTSAFGNDISSNNNDLTSTSMAAANQSIHTPSTVYPKVSNIGTPSGHTAANYTMTNGSNRMVYSGSNQGYFGLTSTQIIQTDDPKIYWEYYLEGGSVGGASGGRVAVGLVAPSFDVSNASGLVGNPGQNNPSNVRGQIYDNGDQGATTPTTLVPVGGYGMIAYEPSTGKMWFGLNGTWSNGSQTASTTLNTAGHDHQTTPQDFAFFLAAARSADITVLNFGDNPTFSGNVTAGTETDGNGEGLFKYAVPSGFLAPNSKNLTAPEYQGIDYFDSTLYEGNGTAQRVGAFVPFTDSLTINNSVNFRKTGTTTGNYLTRTPSAAATSGDSNGTTNWTFSAWIKPNHQDTGTAGSGYLGIVGVDSSNYITLINEGKLYFLQAGSGLITNNLDFVDESNWTHLLVAVDTTQSTASDRVKIYRNGTQITDFSTTNYYAENAKTLFNKQSTAQAVGIAHATNYTYDGYMADVYMIDGQTLTPSSFAQTDTSTNRWVPKAYSGSYGNNGYRLKFEGTPASGYSSSNMGQDSSGNDNDFSEAGVTYVAGNKTNDTPTNNHATFDSRESQIGSGSPGLSNGNLTYTGADNGGRYIANFPLRTGKFYWEIDVETSGSSFYPGFLTPAGIAFTSSTPWNNNAGSFLIAPAAGHWLGTNGSGTTNITSNYTAFISSGDRMFFAYDADNKFAYVGEVGSGGSGSTLTYYTLGGTAAADPTNASGVGAAPFGLHLTGEDTFYFGIISGGTGIVANLLIDSTKWNGTPPTGYKALTQDNMDGTADKITAWSWIKNRDSTDAHMWVDRVRGPSLTIHPNGAAEAEATEVNTVQRFLQRGVQVGNDVQVNTDNESYVLWQWLVGTSGGSGTTTSPAGSTASTSLVADHGGFSIVSYTGTGGNTTVGHGLSYAPEMIIWRARGAANYATVWHNSYAVNYALYTNTTAAPADQGSVFMQSTAPSTTVVSLGSQTGQNANSVEHIMYCFASVPGVMKVGRYTGNGNANGPYVHTGFKPAWVMTKNINDTEDWVVQDNVREPFNLNDAYLSPSQNIAEATGLHVDFLADGFKLRGTSNMTNGTGDEMMYLAMAEIGGNGAQPPIYGA